MINWKERFRNKTFLFALFGAIVILLQQVLPIMGISLDFGLMGEVFNSLIGILVILGIVVDPTTDGVGDSELVLNRNKDKNNGH